jgi:hypothetical protein
MVKIGSQHEICPENITQKFSKCWLWKQFHVLDLPALYLPKQAKLARAPIGKVGDLT